MNDPVAKRIGKRLARFRKEKGLTLDELAARKGFSKGYLSDIENGKRFPTIPLLHRLAKSLGVRLREFF